MDADQRDIMRWLGVHHRCRASAAFPDEWHSGNRKRAGSHGSATGRIDFVVER